MTAVALTLAFAIIALVLAVAMAYLPMRLMVSSMARNIKAQVREWVERQRDRRRAARDTADRRKI